MRVHRWVSAGASGIEWHNMEGVCNSMAKKKKKKKKVGLLGFALGVSYKVLHDSIVYEPYRKNGKRRKRKPGILK